MLHECNQCPYYNSGRLQQQEPTKLDILAVGNFPSLEDLKDQSPLSGRARKLILDSLSTVGLNATVGFTTALLCKPFNDKKVDKLAISLCHDRLINSIKQCKPKYILAMGSVALQSVQNSTKMKISKVQGTPIPWTEDSAITVIPMFSPAKILGNPGEYQTFLNSFIYLKNLYDGGTKKNPGETEYLVVGKDISPDTAVALLKHYAILSCDIETVGLNPLTAEILCVGFGYEKNKVIIFPIEFLEYIKKILEIRTIQDIYHRGQFDTSVLRAHGINAYADHDTILQHYTLNENRGGHDLKTLSARFLGAEDYDTEVNKLTENKSRMDLLPKDKLYKYLALDCDYTFQLHNLFYAEVLANPESNKLYHKILMPALNFLSRVTNNGFMVDMPYLKEYKIELTKELDSIEKRIKLRFGWLWDRELYLADTKAKSAPLELNIRSPKQLGWIIYDLLKLKPTIKEKEPRCTNVKILDNIQHKHPFIAEVMKHRKLNKILTTYVIGIENKVDSDDRLRSTFNLQTTVTGRLSSESPNVQNIPRDKKVKNLFKVPEGKLLVEADYKGVELRILAHYSQDSFLLDCFGKGMDLHDEMSKAIFGPSFTKEQRVAVKGVNFGVAYGREALSIAQEFKISVRSAQQIINDWFIKAPMAKEYMDACVRHLKSRKPFITPMGRFRRYGIITGDKRQENECRNFAIQSTASDLTLLSAMALEPMIVPLQCAIINIVHDSVIIEAPNNLLTIHKLVDIIDSTMRQIPIDWLSPSIPIPVDIQVGKSWGNLKGINILTKDLTK